MPPSETGVRTARVSISRLRLPLCGLGLRADERCAHALDHSCMRRRAGLGYRMESRMLFFPAPAAFDGARRFLEAAIRMRRKNGLNRGLAGRPERFSRIMATKVRRTTGRPGVPEHRVAFRRDVHDAVPSRNSNSQEIDRNSSASGSGRISALRAERRNWRCGPPERPFELSAKPAPV